MVCTAFRAAADTLNQTRFGGLKNMTIKIDQLYFTIASALKPLQGMCNVSFTIFRHKGKIVIFLI